MARDRDCEEWDRMMEDWRKFSEGLGQRGYVPRPGQLIVIPLGPDPCAIDESKMDFSIPFWVGTPVD